MPPGAPGDCCFLTWLIHLDAMSRCRAVGLAMLSLQMVLCSDSCRVNTDADAYVRVMVCCCMGTIYEALLIVHEVQVISKMCGWVV